MTAVTLVRIRADEADTDVRTYVAVRSADAVDLLSDGFELGDAETLPCDVLPEIRELAAAEIGARPRRPIAILGTSEGTGWAT